MKRAISITATFLILGISISLFSCSQKIQQENILATINDQVVTVDELEQEISELPGWKQQMIQGSLRLLCALQLIECWS